MNRSRFFALALTVFAIEIIIVIWVFWATIGKTLAERGYLGISSSELGTWGDSFGVLSSLFTALGFLGVIAGFMSQRDQLRQGQAEQHRQRFDNWYFQLIKLLREARNEVRFRHSVDYQKDKSPPPASGSSNTSSLISKMRSANRPVHRGTDAFKAAWFELRHFLQKSRLDVTEKELDKLYQRYIHTQNESVFGPYFRLLYTILERIDSDKVLSFEEKDRYGRLLRSQLTSYETTLAGINGISTVSKDFDRLVIRFRLLKYLPDGNRKRLLLHFYPKETFEPRD